MPTHFLESKMFAFAMIFATLAVMAAAGFIFYPKYQAEAQLELYAPSQSAVKISEEVKVRHRSNKSGSWSEHIPCITLRLSDAGQPVTACKLTGFVDSPDAARQFLASNFGAASGFTVFVSPDKSKVSLDGFDPTRARSALLPLILILVIVPVCEFGTWLFLQKLVKRQREQKAMQEKNLKA